MVASGLTVDGGQVGRKEEGTGMERSLPLCGALIQPCLPRVRHGRPGPTACASDVFDVLCGPLTTSKDSWQIRGKCVN